MTQCMHELIMPKIGKNWQGTYEWPIYIFEQTKTNKDSTDY